MGMILFDNLLRSLCWSFIHSLWLGLILTILAGFVMLVTKKAKASLRYGVLCALFFLFLGAISLTFMIEWNAGSAKSSGLKLLPAPGDASIIFHNSSFNQIVERIALFLNANSQWIVLTWLFILGFKLTKMMLDLFYIYRLRNNNIFSPADEWKIKLQSLAEGMGLRRKISLLESALVKVPMVMGHFKPVVLIPLGILAQLPPAEIEAVLLHELAHIRRHDYFINFIQRIAELFFFFNPGLIWISGLMRIERENCCDDIAISKTKNKLQFVEALISFKEHAMNNPSYGLGLFGKRSLLLQRMTRITYNRNKSLSAAELAFFSINIIAFVVLVSSIGKPQPVAFSKVSYAVQSSQSVSPTPVRGTNVVSKKISADNNRPVSVYSGHKSTAIIAIKKKVTAWLAEKQDIDTRQMKISLTADSREETEKDRNQARTDFEQSKLQADIDRLQAERDREQADKDRVQADKDRASAELDRKRADNDRLQAERDREQADKDRIQADKDRAQAELDKQAADKDRQQAANYRKAQAIKI